MRILFGTSAQEPRETGGKLATNCATKKENRSANSAGLAAEARGAVPAIGMEIAKPERIANGKNARRFRRERGEKIAAKLIKTVGEIGLEKEQKQPSRKLKPELRLAQKRRRKRDKTQNQNSAKNSREQNRNQIEQAGKRKASKPAERRFEQNLDSRKGVKRSRVEL